MNKFISNIGYATRLNSFRKDRSDNKTAELIKKASTVKGLTFIDLNYPEHVQNSDIKEIKAILRAKNLTLNSVEMRYNNFKNDFGLLALSSNSTLKRKKAIDLTKKAIDYLINLGGKTLTLWPSLEGYDYPFQIDYYKSYENLVNSLKKISLYNKSINISIEFKPNSPFSFSLIPNSASSVLLIKDLGVKNIGLTLDFCHLLMSQESPAASIDYAFHKCKILGIHLNDGYGKNDDGLMVGSVHPIQTFETLYILYKNHYKGVIYFDTFPTYLDPAKECEQNIKFTNRVFDLISTKTPSYIMKLIYYNKIF